jgi:diguanylate cyclase (GGDEF)-like protein
LRRSAIFADLDPSDAAALAAQMRRRAFAAGEAVFRENETGSELFVLVSGSVAVTVRTPDGEEIELSCLEAGAFFGEMAILERAPRSATITAREASVCLALGADDFDALLATQPRTAAQVLQRMLAVASGRLLRTGSFVTQMVQWGDAARKRAITDAATGLFNRRYLEDTFAALVARAAREGGRLSYAMFDLDRFGSLNKLYGADFCDSLIPRLAEIFRRCCADEDILVRYGGDEFCFVLPGPSETAAAKCAAIAAGVRALRSSQHPELRLSCSIGLAHFPQPSRDGDELKEQADKALYQAKEAGRDRVMVWPGEVVPESKRDLPSVAAKNRVIAAIAALLENRERFLVIGHKDPDEDCVSSMVAFALLATKLNKKATICLGEAVQDNFEYLLNICQYNSIEVLRGARAPAADVVVLVDTPKPSMIDRPEIYAELFADPAVVKVELDHHLAADSQYFGDPDYRLVYEASSTCEIIGLLAIKLENDAAFMARHQLAELMTRNLVLAILSGMIGDSQMGRYLKSRRERWFYKRFSAMFEKMLASKTRKDSRNFSSKEQVFDALASLSKDEDACYRFLADFVKSKGGLNFALLDAEASKLLFATFGNDTIVAVAKALVDKLAEGGGTLGLIGYYDDPAASPFIQFRLRRAQSYTALDLRDVLARLGMTNGGGHPGAVGFRIERTAVDDWPSLRSHLVGGLASLIANPPPPPAPAA